MSELAEVSVRELRNHISDVLRRVESGQEFEVTVDRRPVAKLVPLPTRRGALPIQEYAAWRRGGGGTDPGFADELADLVPDTVGDLDPE